MMQITIIKVTTIKIKQHFSAYLVLLILLMSGSSVLSASTANHYYLQFGSYKSPEMAQRELAYRQKNNHLTGLIRKTMVQGLTYYQLQFGPYRQLQQAKQVKQQLGAIANTSYIRAYPATPTAIVHVTTRMPKKVARAKVSQSAKSKKAIVLNKPHQSIEATNVVIKPSLPQVVKPMVIAKRPTPVLIPQPAKQPPEPTKKVAAKPILLYQYRDPLEAPAKW